MRSGGDCLQFFTNIFDSKKIRQLPYYVVIYYQRFNQPKHTTNSIHRRLQNND